ncbi:hypothetical protein C1Y63_01880 [Corynebacterium sp. 13CS0277]|uniref:hypothetical protein n=1 Tax=Corynebacterium sp. 13CS0277 TaxID=2071994 RepID=UPI000D025D1E|nr:hypothetical protein [Corynebacterium sp. 13CS0277]PRQ12325.1 hypothetical protein C1Y63_01880 [Corynebacterium sp. 13CS0277]
MTGPDSPTPGPATTGDQPSAAPQGTAGAQGTGAQGAGTSMAAATPGDAGAAAAPAPEKTWGGFFASVRDELVTRNNLMLVGGAGLVAAMGVVGGFDAAPPEAVIVGPQAEHHVEAAPFDLEITAIQPTVDGLEVELTATNTTKQPVSGRTLAKVFAGDPRDPNNAESTESTANTASDADAATNPAALAGTQVENPAAQWRPKYPIVWKDERFFGGYFNPGVGTAVTVVVPWDYVDTRHVEAKNDDHPEPETLGVGVYGLTYRASAIDGTKGFFDPKLVGVIPVDPGAEAQAVEAAVRAEAEQRAAREAEAQRLREEFGLLLPPVEQPGLPQPPDFTGESGTIGAGELGTGAEATAPAAGAADTAGAASGGDEDL